MEARARKTRACAGRPGSRADHKGQCDQGWRVGQAKCVCAGSGHISLSRFMGSSGWNTASAM